MRKICLIFLLLVMFSIFGFSQSDEDKPQRPDYLTIQTGLIVDTYISPGVRTFFEYKKDLKNNWQYGISYEHSNLFGSFLPAPQIEPDVNMSQLSLNGYYKLNLIKDRLFWTGGLGIGVVHVNWDDNDSFGATINASLTLNIRLTKRIYFVSAPLIALMPSNRIYFSPMNIGHYDIFYAFTFFPFGLKVKL